MLTSDLRASILDDVVVSQATAPLARAISSVQAVASTPQVELFVDGTSAGVQNTTGGIAEFGGPPVGFAANLTALGIDRNGNRVARHELLNSSKPVSKMDLYVDVPSKATGTGEALYMDGQDIAMIRVQFADEDGRPVFNDERNVTWSVSGPIKLAGVSSGNNANPYQQPVQGAVYETYRGLGRVLVQSTVDCTSTNRALARQIDTHTSPSLVYADACPTEAAMVTASIPGLGELSIRLMYSGEPSDHPMAAARANRKLNYTYMDTF